VTKNREFVSTTRKSLASDTGLQAAAIESTHQFLSWDGIGVLGRSGTVPEIPLAGRAAGFALPDSLSRFASYGEKLAEIRSHESSHRGSSAGEDR
jgi:hypothetical protein